MLELGEAMTGKKNSKKFKIKMPNTVFVCVLLYFWFWNLTKCTARLPAHRFAINFWANDGGRAEQNRTAYFLWNGCERGAATTKINERGGKKRKNLIFIFCCRFLGVACSSSSSSSDDWGSDSNSGRRRMCVCVCACDWMRCVRRCACACPCDRRRIEFV